MNFSRLFSCLIAIFLSFAALPMNHCRGGQVNWSLIPFQSNFTSGFQLLGADVIFEMGAFSAGFTPTLNNTADWAASWHPLSRSVYNPLTGQAIGSATITSNAAPFRTSDRGWIWCYNAASTNGEWLLVSDPDWLWPDSSPISPAVSWSLPQAREVVAGNLGGTWQLQTARIPNSPFPRLSFSRWQSVYFNSFQILSGVGGASADPDGDGLSNFEEFSLGTFPHLATSRLTPHISLGADGLSLNYTLKTDPFALSRPIFTFSTDLKEWTALEKQPESGVNGAYGFSLPITAETRFFRFEFQTP